MKALSELLAIYYLQMSNTSVRLQKKLYQGRRINERLI